MVFTLFVFLAVLGLVLGIAPRLLTRFYAGPRLYALETSPSEPVAIVFGAGLYRNGSPTPVLRDRIETAADLYRAGKVEKLLMSGDNSTPNYNEPGAMRDFALDLGIPEEDIILDYAGRRTYDTCYRAREIFHLDSAILVTQSFHLPRALYTCNALGISAVGVSADLRQYRRFSRTFWNLRETVATTVALWEIYVSQPTPILGNPEPIFPREAQ
ncbi:MAG: YdcF family protein [Chloroflexota bacterium]|nr:MAG: YdcF family protein [Chloroflexota bacterium]